MSNFAVQGYAPQANNAQRRSPYFQGGNYPQNVQIPLAFRGNSGIATQIPVEQKKSSLGGTLLKVGLAAVAIGVACHPRTRYAARNLFGEKGLAKFLENKNTTKELHDVVAALKSVPDFEKAVEGMSASNIRRMAEQIKGQPELYGKLIKGEITIAHTVGDKASEAVKLLDITKPENHGYHLYRTVKTGGGGVIDDIVAVQKLVPGAEGKLCSISYTPVKDKPTIAVREGTFVEMESGKTMTTYISAKNDQLPWESVPEAVRSSSIRNNAKVVKIGLT